MSDLELTGLPVRTARLILITPDGRLVGQLRPVPVATPWWQDIAPVVAAVRSHHEVDVTVLRLIEAELSQPHGGEVTYLAEVAAPASAEPWDGALDDHPLRLSYAKPGGPASDLAWARSVLTEQSMIVTGPPQQMRTWNLSSIWRIPTASGLVWLKVVPPFLAHEGDILTALAGQQVPRLLAHDGGRILLANIAGEDKYEADKRQLHTMVAMLVDLQYHWMDRTDALIKLGLPDWRASALAGDIADVVRRTANSLSEEDQSALVGLVDGLQERLAAVEACGIGFTLIHGDFHPGNFRGDGDRLTLLDWSDSGLGHPLLDQSAFLEGVPSDARDVVRQHWNELWRSAVQGSDPVRAAALLAPVAAARRAVVYRKFLDNIEPSEQPYHKGDPALWLRRTATLAAPAPSR